MTPNLFEEIEAILRRNGAETCPHCELGTAAEELHALVVERYGPPF